MLPHYWYTLTMITQTTLRNKFIVNNGIIYHKKSGLIASPNSICKGYRTIHIDGKNYKQHRVIFLYYHGYLPKALDHIDRDKLNNNIDNLRPSTRNGNNHNVGISKANTSGYKGVYWHKPRKKWRAMIKINRKQITLGRFNTKEEAALAYNKAAKKYHGEFAYQNVISQSL